MSFTILNGRGSKRSATYYAPRNKDSLVTRRMFMQGVSAGALVAAMARKARAGLMLGGSALNAVPPSSGFFPSGHWVAPLGSGLTWAAGGGAQTAFSIYPRPDSETAAWARHRHLFFNNVHAWNNQTIPIMARGGAFPYSYQLLQAPAAAGASLGASVWQANWTIAQAIAAGYGDLLCSPNGTFSGGVFHIRIWDQTFSYLDCIFTSSTIAGYDATNGWGYVFLDPSAGVDPGSYPSSGIIDTSGSPIKTLNWAFAASNATTTYPNAVLAMIPTASVPVFAQNSEFGIQPTVNKSPMALVSASTSVTVDLTNAGTHATQRSSAFDIQSGGNDMVFQGITFSGGPSTAVNFHVILSFVQNHRLMLQNVSQPNAWSGTAPTDNASLLTLLESNTRNYLALKGVSDTNRNDGTGTESNSLYLVGQVQYGVMELCSGTGISSYGATWKWSVGDVTLRCSEFTFAAGFKGPGGSDNFIGSQGIQPLMQNQEICYCIFDGHLVSSGGHSWGCAFNISSQSNGANTLLAVSYRNSYVGILDVDNPSGNTGPFMSVSDAIEWRYGDATQPIMISRANSPLPGNVTNTNTTSQAASGIFNSPGTGDYSLVNSGRTGLEGATIA